MQPSIMFAGQLLFLVKPLPPFLPIFLRKHSHFRSTPYLPYHSQFVSVADWRCLRSAFRAEPLMQPEFSIPPIWSRIRSLFRPPASPPYRSQLLLAADLRFRVPLSLVQSEQ